MNPDAGIGAVGTNTHKSTFPLQALFPALAVHGLKHLPYAVVHEGDDRHPQQQPVHGPAQAGADEEAEAIKEHYCDDDADQRCGVGLEPERRLGLG